MATLLLATYFQIVQIPKYVVIHINMEPGHFFLAGKWRLRLFLAEVRCRYLCRRSGRALVPPATRQNDVAVDCFRPWVGWPAGG